MAVSGVVDAGVGLFVWKIGLVAWSVLATVQVVRPGWEAGLAAVFVEAGEGLVVCWYWPYQVVWED